MGVVIRVVVAKLAKSIGRMWVKFWAEDVTAESLGDFRYTNGTVASAKTAKRSDVEFLVFHGLEAE